MSSSTDPSPPDTAMSETKDDSSASSPSLLDDIVVVTHDPTPIEPVLVETHDANDEQPPDEESQVHPGKKVVDDVMKNVKDTFENTSKTIKEMTKNTKGAIDEHVVPHVENITSSTRSSIKALGDNTSKSFRALGDNTSKSFKALGDSTKGAIDQHVVPHVEILKQNTSKTLEAVGNSTRGAIDEHVVPHVETLKQNTSKTFADVSKNTRGAYVDHVEPHVSIARSYAPYYMGTAPALFWHGELHLDVLLQGTARAFGQVVFCNNPFTGLLVWLGILSCAPMAALCAITCVVTVNLIAHYYLNMDPSLIKRGLLAYNSVLVGSGIATFLTFGGIMGWMLLFVVSILTAPVTLMAHVYVCGKTRWPLHLPANAVLIVLLLSAVLWDDASVELPLEQEAGFVKLLFQGVSQMVLIKGAFSGFLMVVGMAFFSRILAAAALAGSLAGIILGNLLVLEQGLFPNAALTCVACTCFVLPSKKTIGLAFFGIVVTLGFHSALEALYSITSIPITTMTLPFCLATLAVFTALDSETYCSVSLQLVTDAIIPEEHMVVCVPDEKNTDATEELVEVEDDQDEADIEKVDSVDTDATQELIVTDEMVATEETPLLVK